MEECKICYDLCKIEKIKKIKCGHRLCGQCYLKLLISECPYCREPIFYTKAEKNIRKKMGVDTNPDFSSNIVYNPVDFAYNHTLTNDLTTLNISPESNSDSPNFTLNRTTRNRHRRILRQVNMENNNSNNNSNNRSANDRRRQRSKRRRKLTDEEIKEKRRIINIKKKMRFIKREGRLRKTIAWYNNEID
ncbi:hypothetical protein CPAV1605_878 [seawater metagenome]|uniref:RING-type domain-containing protein n=1 Tax=seawater metagenome TaxID=1561972 RepID=A0A5E8CID6_9ZZZZ